MKSYIERVKFEPDLLRPWEAACRFVARVSDDWGDELRCHELARAVRSMLLDAGFDTFVVDGHLFSIEHSWLMLGYPRWIGPYNTIIDVYCPGRLPQVQLIDHHWAIARGYEAGKERTDINETIVEKLVEEMRKE